jgi:hypothetical protein
MTYYEDLSRMSDPRLALVAVGWLEPEHPYVKGDVEERFFARLMELLVEPWQPFAAAGRHECRFCAFSGGPGTVSYAARVGQHVNVSIGWANVFVPGRDVLYMAPSTIAHYIDSHGYKPPAEFVDAVLACPEMKSAAYLRAIHAVGGAKLLKAPSRDAEANRTRATVLVSHACPDCRAPVTITHVQCIAGERLRYYEGLHCVKCGCAVEADGDVLPDVIRGLFYSNHGRWALEIVDAGPQRVIAARAIAAVLGVAPPDALRRLQPNTMLEEGTRIEIELLERQLRPFDVLVRVVPHIAPTKIT